MKKVPLIIIVCCLLMLTIVPIQAFGAEASKPAVSHTVEYSKWGVTVVKKIYYHDGIRIRIFQDIKSDKSFEKSFVDVKGTVDVRLLRNAKGVVTKLQFIDKEEADEILEDMLDSDPDSDLTIDDEVSVPVEKETGIKTKEGEIIDIERCLISEIPTNIQVAISNSTGKGFYVIEGNGRQYIYYNNISKDYAFQSEGTNLNIRDIGRKTGIYVLLSLPEDVSFKLSYNSKPIRYTRVVA